MPFRYVAITTCANKTEPPTGMSFRANAVSRGIHSSSKFYLVVISYPTWWIPPLRLRCGRNDNGGCFWFLSETVPSFRVLSKRRPLALPEGEARGCIAWYHSPAQVIIATWRAADCRWNYGVIATGNQLILIRCAKHHPYDTFVTYTVYLTCLSTFCVLKNSKSLYVDVGAATCRPPRIGYNLFI